jgi:aryl-alcohol dehydrogenase-like predicted oxidoreductase
MTLSTRKLGRTGADVTILGFGAMELRGQPRGPAITDDDAGKVLHAVLDGGINLIDTSVDYGRSEELIGRHLSDRRDEYFLASKCGCPLEPPPDATPPYAHDYRPANVRAGVEQSLRRLRTDRLDLVQVHMSPSRAQLEADGTVATLQALRDEGKVRFLGMSGILPHLPDHIAMGVFDVFQIPYSAVQREHEDLIAEGQGRDRWQAAGLDDLLDGMSRLEFMLRFTLSHPDLSTTIVGTASIDHLRSNLAVAEKGPLPDAVYAEATRRLAPAER